MASDWQDWALIALGSNLSLGDSGPREIVLSAMERLEELSKSPIRRSSLWRSTPMDCPPDSPLFINAAVAVRLEPGQTPEQLLDHLQSMESDFHRERNAGRNGPRTLDLDLIAFGNCKLNSERLTLPHPRARQRSFVLFPLAEIASDFVFPGGQDTVAALKSKLSGPLNALEILKT